MVADVYAMHSMPLTSYRTIVRENNSQKPRMYLSTEHNFR